MRIKEKCSVCNGSLESPYNPMKEWGIKGQLCSKCYSQKIFEHYPGKHDRVTADE